MRADPTTRAEWQEAVDTADALLHRDSACRYGLVDVARAGKILKRGAAQGVYPGGRRPVGDNGHPQESVYAKRGRTITI